MAKSRYVYKPKAGITGFQKFIIMGIVLAAIYAAGAIAADSLQIDLVLIELGNWAASTALWAWENILNPAAGWVWDKIINPSISWITNQVLGG